MKILLEKRADIECKDDFGITPLFVAAQYGRLESLRTLISHGNSSLLLGFVVLKLTSDACHQIRC